MMQQPARCPRTIPAIVTSASASGSAVNLSGDVAGLIAGKEDKDGGYLGGLSIGGWTSSLPS